MSVNPEDWDVDFAFPDFNLALFERERSWCRNWIVAFPWKKIWSVFENFNADHPWRREWPSRNSRGFPRKINERIFDNDNKLTLKSFFAFCSVFFFHKNQRRKDGNDFEKDTVPGFQNTPALHLRAKTYSALSFDQINFFNEANLFSLSRDLSRKPFVVCCCFRGPIKTFFLDACEMIVKSRVLHLFPVPETRRSHIINILLASFFRSVL